MKRCSNCGENKLIGEFSCTKRNKDGSCKYYASWCKVCRSNAENTTRRLKGVKEKIKPLLQESGKECLECHEIKPLSEFSPASRGRLGYAAYCKPCHNKRFRATKEAARISTQKYRDTNRNWWRSLHRINQFNRRHLIKAQSDGTVTTTFVDSIYSLEICYWCKEYIEKEFRTLEHIIELNSGGLHSINNITMACVSCNSARKGK